MRIVKLSAGETLTMVVNAIDEVQGQYGPQYDIQGFASPSGEPVRIYLGTTTADRQFERIGLSAGGAEGETLTIGKVQKGSKAYVNIDRAGAAAAVPARQSAPPVNEGPPPESDDEFQARMRGESAPRHAVAPEIPMTAVEQRQHTTDNQPSAWSDAVLHTAIDYEVCVDRAGQILERQGRKHGFGFDGAAVQAMAFSIFGKTEERVRRGGLR